MVEEKKNKRLEVASLEGPEDDETCQTFVMHDEDHTLGNSLRYIVMKNPEVEFCGYSIPHPSENKINFRIQTKGVPATGVLEKGLEDLMQLCKHVLDTFQLSVETYRQQQDEPSHMDTT